ncbi:MAG: DDE-type integrase/transposase/recombinase [Alphaproteobacteria bacterium]|nr:DDE-type integrase/transposase/recombinase [Alphaproteobacteria bacterium]
MEKKAAVIAAICEGVSIRATSRLHDVHKNTILSLGLKVGQGCTAVHGKLMKNLQIGRIELDEVWSFVAKKKKNVTENDPDTVGDQFIYLAIDSTGKAIISWLVGKRNARNTLRFVEDVRYRVLGEPEFSTDGYQPYPKALELVFDNAPHGIVDKQMVVVAGGPDSEHYYAKETLVKVERTAVRGAPAHISTSFIERQNLTLRQSSRRLTRLSSGFSKKYENHCAAIALYATHYNFCRVHETLRITPAMHLGVTDHVWSISELIGAALDGEIQTRVEREKSRFRVIQGGRI